MKIEPMLVFDGDCSEALKFYTEVFNGKQVNVQTYGDNREHLAKEHRNFTPKWKDKIMHASFVIPSGEKIFMADRHENTEFHQGNADSLALEFVDENDMEKIYNALSKDGTIVVPIQKAFWHAMYAEITDKFKKHWKLNCQIVSLD
ncbi:MAG: VOC family protein [Bacteroidales bacterium]|nr:VOC family protein [Bacteroidales bacterium]